MRRCNQLSTIERVEQRHDVFIIGSMRLSVSKIMAGKEVYFFD